MRRANGVIALVLIIFFSIHEILGSLYLDDVITAQLASLVWIGVILIGAHAALSAITSRQMLTDPVRPPSKKKRIHLTKKWASGILVAFFLVFHIVTNISSLKFGWISLLLALALVIHICISSKSLAKDLSLPNIFKWVFRIASIAIIIGAAVMIFLRIF